MTPRPPNDALPSAAQASAPLLHRVLLWFYEQRWLLAVFGAALAVRLHWNLEVHALGDYIYSDMNGYVTRADRMLRDPWTPHEYSAFFPPATHWMLAGFKKLFGSENYRAFAIFYAFLGAGAVAMAYSVARRASRFAFVAPLVGLFGVIYYPLISLGGYILSETPYSFCLMAALCSAQRMADHGRKRDAWAMGAFAGFGALVRPQLLLSAAAIGLYWIVRRKSLPNIRFTLLLQSAIPLALFLSLGAVHFHHHTERTGLVSENGTFNLVFGRCHNSKIESQPDGKGHGKVHFRPPPFLQVNNLLRESRRTRIPPEVSLNPAIHDELAYKGYIGDREAHMKFIRECWAKTGVVKQAEYSWLNVSLLWRHNIPWPDSGKGGWRAPATWWTEQHRYYLAIPALLGLLWMFVPGRRAAKLGLVSANLLALLVLASIFFGGARHRAPYDLVIIILAFETYATIGWGVWKAIQRWALPVLGLGGGANPGSSATSGSTGASKPAGGKSAQNSSSS